MEKQYIIHNALVVSLLMCIFSPALGAEEQSHQKKESASAEKSHSLTTGTVIVLSTESSPHQSDKSLESFEKQQTLLMSTLPASARGSSHESGRSLTEGAIVSLTTESSPTQSNSSSGNSCSGQLERLPTMLVLPQDSAASSSIACLMPPLLTANALRESFEALGLLTSHRRSQQEQRSCCQKICSWFRSWCQRPEPVMSDQELHERVERLIAISPDNSTLKKLEISLIFRHLLASQEASNTSTKIGLMALLVSIISGTTGIYGAANS